MNPLGSLKSLILKLRKEEVRSLLLFLNFQLPNPNEESKSAQLVRMILDDPGYNALDLQKVLYGKINSAAFYKLVARLKQKVLEVMIFDQHLQSDSYNLRNKAIFSLRKKLLEVDLLFNRGIVDEVEGRLKEIKKEALKYELYDILFQSNSILRRFYITRKRNKMIEFVSNEIGFYKKTEFLFDQAGAEFNKIMNKINFSFSYADYADELKIVRDNLEKWYQDTKSPTIGYYFILLNIESLQSAADYNGADVALDNMRILFDDNSAFPTSSRWGTYYLNKANNYLYLDRLAESEIFVNKALWEFRGNSLNSALSEEVLFYSKYYQGKYDACQSILVKVRSAYKSLDQTILNRFQYYEAVLDFKRKDYTKVLEKLSKLPQLSRDKEGWNVVIKILQVLCRIEQKEFESADLSVQNLERYLKRIGRQKHLKPRYIIILRILLKLINESYNYHLVYHKKSQYFDLLNSGGNGYIWTVKSPELIIFNDWFKTNLS